MQVGEEGKARKPCPLQAGTEGKKAASAVKGAGGTVSAMGG